MSVINPKDFQVTSKVDLVKERTILFEDQDEKELEKKLKKVRKLLGKLQDTIYAHDTYRVLICLQGMDTSGKDSLIREVFKDFNARGVEVTSFKVPTELEISHDYLWRHYIALPQRGRFGVHNRTHYENVLVTRVHPEYIMSENLPGVHSVADIDEAFWDKRFEQIINFENHLVENGTIIYKFFMHLSKEEQKSRLLRRLNKQEKNWKFSAGDLKERKLWDQYQTYYEDAINRTSSDKAPWYIIPADNKPAARLAVATILLETLQQYDDIKEPELDDKTKANLASYKEQLENE